MLDVLQLPEFQLHCRMQDDQWWGPEQVQHLYRQLHQHVPELSEGVSIAEASFAFGR